MSTPVWLPPADARATTDVGRFMEPCAVASSGDTRARSAEDPSTLDAVRAAR